MVENVFGCQISYFQSDGGGEYRYSPFELLLEQSGITHRFSCPHTPPQNGEYSVVQ